MRYLIWLIIILFFIKMMQDIGDLKSSLWREQERSVRLEQTVKNQQKDFDQKIREATKTGSLVRPRRQDPLYQKTIQIASYDISRLKDYVRQLFGTHSEEAFAVISCEDSTYSMSRIGYGSDGTGHFGPFQVAGTHSVRFGTSFITDPMENILVGYKIWKEQGWTPWLASNNCHHLMG